MTAPTPEFAERWVVVQAEAHGVTGTRRLADVAPGGWDRLIRPPSGVESARTLSFARGEVGAEYGFLTIASIAFDLVTPSWLRCPIRRPNTWICSALGAEALRCGGWIHPWPDIYQPTPSEVMHALLDSGGIEIPVATARPGDVGFAHSRGILGAAIRLAEHGTPDHDVNHMFVLDHTTSEARPTAP